MMCVNVINVIMSLDYVFSNREALVILISIAAAIVLFAVYVQRSYKK